LHHALVEVYRDWLPRGRFPAAVLFVRVPPELVDVNVHPAKWEVRFAEPRAIHELVRQAVRDAVGARRWLGGAPAQHGDSATTGYPAAQGGRESSASAVREGADKESSDWLFTGGSQGREAAASAEQLEWTASPSDRVRFADLKLLGQLMATYLVLETPQQLLLIDQHAAHERVLFERLRAQWLERGVESQGLLTPQTLRLEAAPLAALSDCGDAIERLGFDWEDFGDGTVALRSLPALLADRDPAQLLSNLAEQLATAGPAADALRIGSRSLEAADQVFASLACHSARRKGEVLDPREQRALLVALDAIPWAPCCPHGRPVSVPFELAEIERRFARR
jgi:DNA mismatch repair protein MutL